MLRFCDKLKNCPRKGSPGNLHSKLYSQGFTAFTTTSSKNVATVFSRHACTESVNFLTLTVVRVESWFYGYSTSSRLTLYLQVIVLFKAVFKII